jgi:hypothetical protein
MAFVNRQEILQWNSESQRYLQTIKRRNFGTQDTRIYIQSKKLSNVDITRYSVHTLATAANENCAIQLELNTSDWSDEASTNYRPGNVKKDGNCFYSAVSCLLFGDEDGGHLLRFFTLKKLLDMEPQFRENLAKYGVSFKQMFLDISRDKFWANTETILVTSLALNRNIMVVTDLSGTGNSRNRNVMYRSNRSSPTTSCIPLLLKQNHFYPLFRHHNGDSTWLPLFSWHFDDVISMITVGAGLKHLRLDDNVEELERPNKRATIRQRDVESELGTAIIRHYGDKFDYGTIQSLYEKSIAKLTGNIERKLRSYQAEAAYKLLTNQDLLCILATNAGKSLIQLVPSLIMAEVTAYMKK